MTDVATPRGVPVGGHVLVYGVPRRVVARTPNGAGAVTVTYRRVGCGFGTFTEPAEGGPGMNPDVTVPPCDADAVTLPAVGDRVRHVHSRKFGTVHGVGALYGPVLLVTMDGAFFAELFPASDWESVEPDPDEDDGFAEHDADDAIKDALYEDGAS